jgi:hypothetical protein
MDHISSYHHFSPCQLRQLKFEIKIRCIRNGLEQEHNIETSSHSLISRQIGWQENIACSASLEDTLQIFTRIGNIDDKERFRHREDQFESMSILVSIPNKSRLVLSLISLH